MHRDDAWNILLEHSQEERTRKHGIAVANGPATVVAKSREKGLLLSVAGDKVVRFAPPYVVERAQIDEAIGTLRAVLADGAGK